MPPVLPDEAAREIRTKTFTANADKDIVIQMYRAFFGVVRSRLHRLQLPGLGWGDMQAIKLSAALCHFDELHEIDLRGNEFGEAGMASFLGWLHTNSSLRRINSMPAAALRGDDPSVSELDWSVAAMPMGSDGTPMGAASTDGQTPRAPLDWMDAQIMAELLQTNQHLVTLSLAGHALRDRGIVALAQLLSASGSRLKALDLSRTHMGNPGATALFEALRRNRTLTTLRAPGNRLGMPSWQVSHPHLHTPSRGLRRLTQAPEPRPIAGPRHSAGVEHLSRQHRPARLRAMGRAVGSTGG